MKKQKLRRLLALCIIETLAPHKLTIPNVKRYLTPDFLAIYTIRKNTRISDQDIRIAMDMVHKAIRLNPIPFRYAPRSSPWGIKREKYFLHTPIADLI